MPSKTVIQTIPAEELVSINDEYQLYKNNNLGVSIKIPKTLNSCVMNIKTDEFVYNKEICDKFRVNFSLKQILGTNKLSFVFDKPTLNTDSEYFEEALGGKTLEVLKFNSRQELINYLDNFDKNCKVQGFTKSEKGNKTPIMHEPEVAEYECPFNMVRKWIHINDEENKMIIFSGWSTAVYLVNSEIQIKNAGPNELNIKSYDLDFMDNVTFY